jgi:cholesterol transport system auxiliary component
MKRVIAAGVFFLALNGCALLSKGEVPVRRYFSPDLAPVADRASQRSTSELRLGRITAGAYIAERIMFRESEHEVGFYDDRLWTEKPESYVRRSLTRVLFEEQGLRSVVRGAAPTLDIELLAFEEVMKPTHLARVKISFALSDERVVSLQQTLTVDHPVVKGDNDAEVSAVAQAMGEALRDAVYEISGRVVADLAKTASTPAPCPVAAAR